MTGWQVQVAEIQWPIDREELISSALEALKHTQAQAQLLQLRGEDDETARAQCAFALTQLLSLAWLPRRAQILTSAPQTLRGALGGADLDIIASLERPAPLRDLSVWPDLLSAARAIGGTPGQEKGLHLEHEVFATRSSILHAAPCTLSLLPAMDTWQLRWPGGQMSLDPSARTAKRPPAASAIRAQLTTQLHALIGMLNPGDVLTIILAADNDDWRLQPDFLESPLGPLMDAWPRRASTDHWGDYSVQFGEPSWHAAPDWESEHFTSLGHFVARQLGCEQSPVSATPRDLAGDLHSGELARVLDGRPTQPQTEAWHDRQFAPELNLGAHVSAQVDAEFRAHDESLQNRPLSAQAKLVRAERIARSIRVQWEHLDSDQRRQITALVRRPQGPQSLPMDLALPEQVVGSLDELREALRLNLPLSHEELRAYARMSLPQ